MKIISPEKTELPEPPPLVQVVAETIASQFDDYVDRSNNPLQFEAVQVVPFTRSTGGGMTLACQETPKSGFAGLFSRSPRTLVVNVLHMPKQRDAVSGEDSMIITATYGRKALTIRHETKEITAMRESGRCSPDLAKEIERSFAEIRQHMEQDGCRHVEPEQALEIA